MKRSLTGLALITAALALTACSQAAAPTSTAPAADDAAAGPHTLVVSVVPSSNVAPLYLGVEQGIFEEHGLKLDVRLSAGFAANVAAVANGETDIGFGTTVPIVGAIANGVPIKIIGHSDILDADEARDYSGLFVPKGSDIDDLADLEGKTVAVNALSNVFDVALKSAMEKIGADASKVEFLEVALPDMVAALDTGRVDAAAVGEPFTTLARNAGNTEVMKVFGAGFEPGTPIASYFVSDSWAGQNADAAKAFAAALQESSEYAAAHREEAQEIMSTYTKIPADVLAQVEVGTYESVIDDAKLEKLAKLMASVGAISTAPDAAAMVVK